MSNPFSIENRSQNCSSIFHPYEEELLIMDFTSRELDKLSNKYGIPKEIIANILVDWKRAEEFLSKKCEGTA